MTQPPGGVVGPAGPPPPGSPPASTEGQATIEKAWHLYRQRIGTHNVTALRETGKALDAVNNLIRSH